MVKTNNLFGDVFRNKKIIITGNTGFKGSWLSLWLHKLGADVYGISKDIPTKPSMFENLKLDTQLIHYFEDVRNLEATSKIINKIKPDFIFHLAAQALVSVSYTNPIDTITTNVIGTANILEICKDFTHNCNIIIITSDKCYDNVEWVWGYKETDAVGGKDIYSGSKGAAEVIFKSYFHSFYKSKNSKVRIASVRAGNVIGGGDWAEDRIVPDCVRAWSNGKYVEIRSPQATRPWQHVLEPLSGYLTLAQNLLSNVELNGGSFNFGPNAEYSHKVVEIINDISKYWNFKSVDDVYRITDNIKFHEAGLLKLNCDKALFYLKWKPTLNYEKLIEFTSQWYFNFYNSKEKMYEFTLEQIKEYEDIAKNKKLIWTQ